MLYIKRMILNILQKFLGNEEVIKLQEYIKGLYRYPHKMIGRKIPINLDNKKTDILVFAAHPDDEVLGLSATLQRYKKMGKTVTVVYVTNGSSRGEESWQRGKGSSKNISKLRYEESVRALSLIHIPSEHIFCLGFPDAGSQRYLEEIAKDVQLLLTKLKPDKVYVHCIEGGHNDHDLVSLVVRSVSSKVDFLKVFEWAEYSERYPLGTKNMKFLAPLPHNQEKEKKINLSAEELICKREMLACHQSQNVEGMFEQGEVIRKAHLTHLDEEIVANTQIIKEDWNYLVSNFLTYMEKERKLTSSVLEA